MAAGEIGFLIRDVANDYRAWSDSGSSCCLRYPTGSSRCSFAGSHWRPKLMAPLKALPRCRCSARLAAMVFPVLPLPLLPTLMVTVAAAGRVMLFPRLIVPLLPDPSLRICSVPPPRPTWPPPGSVRAGKLRHAAVDGRSAPP